MQLRSGQSLWQAVGPPPISASPLQGDAACEVAVIGGGVTGALVAHHLLREGVDVALVDKRNPGVGSTAASTGLLQYEADTPLVDLVNKIGESAAVHSYRRGVRAIDEIEQLAVELRDPCGFVRRDSFYFASCWWHRGRLRKEFECRAAHGFDVEFVKPAAGSAGYRAHAAIRSRGDGQIDPYRFTLALLNRCRTLGMQIYAHSEVLKIDESEARVALHTAQGILRAQRIVFATGYESEKYLSRKVGKLHSTYAVASTAGQKFDDWPEGELIWETARPYFYARQSDDGRAMIGGGDTLFSNDHKRDGLVERKVARLQRRFSRLFPAYEFVPEFAWAGTFGESSDGLPYIGVASERPRAYFALGYGGNGITFAMIAARLIADLYVGRPNADQAVFRFGR